MPTRPFLTSGLIACVMLTGGCATQVPASAPLLTLPDIARERCGVAVLPANPTQSDLDAAYAVRGSQVAVCEGKRALAVEAFDAQQRVLAPPPKPFWRRWIGG